MDLNKLPLFSLMAQRLGWLSERQRVLAENVANADTPGYQARDVKPLDFAKALSGARPGGAPAATNKQHLGFASGRSAAVSVVKAKPIETKLSGNSVSLDAEAMKVSQTAMDYQVVTNLYKKQIALLRSVLGRS